MRAAITLSISAAILGLGGVGVLAGCGSGPVPAGVFRGEHHLEFKPGADPVVAKQLSRVELTIEQDGKATLEDGGFPFEGQVTRRDSTLEFEVLAVSGKNIEKQPDSVPRQFKFTLAKDGTIQFLDVTLVRQP